ncbi:MAG: hypothetical protein GY847_18265 [Proteobacteria bacterium]|nr:hypothetical protein [Pseudomonadota bacterium]
MENLTVFIPVGADRDVINRRETVEPRELRTWKAQKGMGDCDKCIFLDGDVETDGPAVWDKFVKANPSFNYTGGIPVIIDKNMIIREISGTYEWDQYPLETIEQLLEE